LTLHIGAVRTVSVGEWNKGTPTSTLTLYKNYLEFSVMICAIFLGQVRRQALPYRAYD
jgi:hypothetical protein